MLRPMTVVILSSVLFCSGCAVFNRNNTPALNLVEKHLVPADPTARAISSAVVVPLGFVAATADMLLLHPLSVAKDAWADTNKLLWENLDWENRFVTTTVFNAPRAAAMPVVFTVDLLARSSFDISRRGGDIRLNRGSNVPKQGSPAKSF